MIPGVETFHPRSHWEGLQPHPVSGPLDFSGNNDTCVVHYTGADDLIDGDPGEYASQLPQYLANIQKSYVERRGYSIGYSFAVDWLGGVWQLRGWEFQSAANRNHNDHTIPILVLVDGQDGTTPEAAKSIRNIVREATRRAGRKVMAVTGHGRLSGAATQCPGLGLLSQLDRGLFNPSNYPFDNVAPPQVPEFPEGDKVFVDFCKHRGHPAVYAQYNNGTKVWIPNQNVLSIMKLATGKNADYQSFIMNADDNWIAATGAIVGPVPSGVDGFGRPV